jgi:hypothetical protein
MAAIRQARTTIESMFPVSRLCMKAKIPEGGITIIPVSPTKIAPNTTRSRRNEPPAGPCSLDSRNYEN